MPKTVVLLQFSVDDNDNSIAETALSLVRDALLLGTQSRAVANLTLHALGHSRYVIQGIVDQELHRNLPSLQEEVLARVQSLLAPPAARLGLPVHQARPVPHRVVRGSAMSHASSRLRRATSQSDQGTTVMFFGPDGREACSIIVGGSLDESRYSPLLVGWVVGYGKVHDLRTVKLWRSRHNSQTIVVPNRILTLPPMHSFVCVEVSPLRSGRNTYQAECFHHVQRTLFRLVE